MNIQNFIAGHELTIALSL